MATLRWMRRKSSKRGMNFEMNAVFFVVTSAGDRPALPLLKQQFSISELIASRGDAPNHMVDSEETGLQDHSEENCLYCVGASVLGYPTQPQINSTHTRTGEGPVMQKLFSRSRISKLILLSRFMPRLR